MAAIAAIVDDVEAVAEVAITRVATERKPSTMEATTTRAATVNGADKPQTGETMMVGRSTRAVKDSASGAVARLETTTMAWVVHRTKVQETMMVASEEVGDEVVEVDVVDGEEEVKEMVVLADLLSTRTEAISSNTCDCFDPASFAICCG